MLLKEYSEEFSDVLELCLNKIAKLEEPWRYFEFGKPFHHSYANKSEYINHFYVREAINEYHGFSARIIRAGIPLILSPLLWETVSGIPRERVHSLKHPDKCISQENYDRNKLIYSGINNSLRINVLDVRYIITSIKSIFEVNDLPKDFILKSIDRRVSTLLHVQKRIENDELMTCVFLAPSDLEYVGGDVTFSSSLYFDSYLERDSSNGEHQGAFIYCPNGNLSMLEKRWEKAKSFVSGRSDFPKCLQRPIAEIDPEFLERYAYVLKKFNRRSLDILKTELLKLRTEVLNPSVKEETKTSGKLLQLLKLFAKERSDQNKIAMGLVFGGIALASPPIWNILIGGFLGDGVLRSSLLPPEVVGILLVILGVYVFFKR